MNLQLDADACVRSTIRHCLSGSKIVSPKDTSWEQLYYSTGMQYPRRRIMTNPHRPLNLVVAVARFNWMIAANNRLEDIAFYEPKVRGFSDDGITVPGSDYGLRIFQPRPGLNQIEGVVARLRKDSDSRRAAVVVWQPEDAVRESSDIPCTFGLFFHIRQDKLQMSVSMRANNAFRILPFNLFEFSMLQELVATELHCGLGEYHHWAASMHVYENARETKPTVDIAGDVAPPSIEMPSMPVELGTFRALRQANEFSRAEAAMRHAVSETELQGAYFSAPLDDYWRGLLSILFTYNCAVRNYPILWDQIPQWATETVTNNIYKYTFTEAQS